jgi:dTDP-4-dehydrorhamnose reductase
LAVSHTEAGVRWLITGAQGQLGRTLGAVARARGLEVQAPGRDRLDIADAARVAATLDEFSPAVVLNCAAYTQVDQAEREPEAARRGNVEGPGVLAAACRDRCLLVHFSTDYVFDGTAHQPLVEDAPTRPLSVYGRTKLDGELAVRAAGGEHLIVRTQWVIGPGRGFVRTILQAAREGRRLRVVDDQLGRPTWTGALADGVWQALDRGARGVLHLACEGIASWYDLARAAVVEGARRGLNPRSAVEPISSREMPRPAPRPPYAVLGLERARALGIAMADWRDALEAYLAAEQDGRDV